MAPAIHQADLVLYDHCWVALNTQLAHRALHIVRTALGYRCGAAFPPV